MKKRLRGGTVDAESTRGRHCCGTGAAPGSRDPQGRGSRAVWTAPTSSLSKGITHEAKRAKRNHLRRRRDANVGHRLHSTRVCVHRRPSRCGRWLGSHRAQHGIRTPAGVETRRASARGSARVSGPGRNQAAHLDGQVWVCLHGRLQDRHARKRPKRSGSRVRRALLPGFAAYETVTPADNGKAVSNLQIGAWILSQFSTIAYSRSRQRLPIFGFGVNKLRCSATASCRCTM